MLGGIAATGAMARTATNVRAGARSPIAAVVHAVFVLRGAVVLAPLVAYLPDGRDRGAAPARGAQHERGAHFVHLVRVAPRCDVPC